MEHVRSEVGRMGLRPSRNHILRRLRYDSPRCANITDPALWFLPERLGYKRQRAFEVETLSDVAFTSNPGQQTETRVTANR